MHQTQQSNVEDEDDQTEQLGLGFESLIQDRTEVNIGNELIVIIVAVTYIAVSVGLGWGAIYSQMKVFEYLFIADIGVLFVLMLAGCFALFGMRDINFAKRLMDDNDLVLTSLKNEVRTLRRLIIRNQRMSEQKQIIRFNNEVPVVPLGKNVNQPGLHFSTEIFDHIVEG